MRCRVESSAVVPSTGRTTFENAVTNATNRSVGEGFRLVKPQTYNTLDQRQQHTPTVSATTLQGKKPGVAMDATLTPQENTRAGDTQRKPPDSTTMIMSTLQNSYRSEAARNAKSTCTRPDLTSPTPCRTISARPNLSRTGGREGVSRPTRGGGGRPWGWAGRHRPQRSR
jgi:hypothetical protein